MDLSRALNQRLCQSCCRCPMAHHISSSQTPLGRERREDTSHRKAPGMTRCVCAAWGLGSSWGSLHFACSAEAPCSWMWRHTLPGGLPKSQLSSPSWDGFCLSRSLHHPCGNTSSWTGLCQYPFYTQRSQAHQSRHHSALMQYFMLIHLENT